MDPVTAKLMSAAGVAAEPIYVDDVFSTFLYDGNDTARSIVNGIDLGGEGGMVWIKARDANATHSVWDTERGTNKAIFTQADSAESNYGSGTLTAFNSNGFSLGTSGITNDSAEDYCSWTFRKCPGFFDVVTYTGNGSNRTISHNLGSVPGSIWIKQTSGQNKWSVYHRGSDSANPSHYELHLNETEAIADEGDVFNDTEPTSTVFTVGTNSGVNGSGQSYVAYIFAHDDQSFGDGGNEAIIKCDTYTGDGTTSNDINVGFEPQWLLIKKSSSSGDWMLFDNMRGIVSGEQDEILLANSSLQESQISFNTIKLTALGFTIEESSTNNASGSTYIYIAIRRPHKPPEAATDVFALDTSDNTRTNGMEFDAGFAVDWYFYASATGNGNRFLTSRLRSGRELNINSSGSDSGATTSEMDSTDGCHNGSLAGSGFIARMWKRAPGFCDVVNYLGNAIDRSVEHNLGVVPEMMIVKNCQKFTDWYVYHKEMTTTHAVYWNDNDAEFSTTVWYTDPRASVFYVSSAAALNDNFDQHIALLFATLDGISKVGSYSGTGNDLNVDCGFTAGARFVMIKRIDASGHWHQFDTEQGINSGDEPFLLLNGTTRTTGQDYIDPLNAGFTITSAAPDDINASGGTYIFLAIA